MFDYLYSIILGIVQGIAEFLPISSSAHLIVVSYFMNGQHLSLTLNVALHFGTVLAVILYFFKDWWNLAYGVVTRDKKETKLFISLVLASVPAGIIGILFSDKIEEIFHNPLSTSVPLIIVGILLYLFDKKSKTTTNIDSLSIWQAFSIGCFQAIALIPGVSRSGISILQGRRVGLDRSDATKFSFLLGTPAMIGACILESKNILSHIGNPVFYIGILSSFIAGYLSISWLLKIIRRYNFLGFMIYRIILGVIIVLFYFI